MRIIECQCCGAKISLGTCKVEGKTQKERLANVLKDNKPHSTFELVRKVYGVNVATVARLASRVDELRNDGWTIISRRSKKNPSKWWYMALIKGYIITDEIMQDENCIIDHTDINTGEYE